MDNIIWQGIISGALLLALVLSPVFLIIIITYVRWRRNRSSFRKEEDLPICLHCGYDLRGLSIPRCPECGTLKGFKVPFKDMGIGEKEISLKEKPRSQERDL